MLHGHPPGARSPPPGEPSGRGPAVVDRDVTAGGAWYVKRARVVTAEVPPGVVTRTSTVPTARAGLVTRRVVAETRTTLLVVVGPNCTAVARVRPVPVSVTVDPPAVGPDAGEMPVTTGTAS